MSPTDSDMPTDTFSVTVATVTSTDTFCVLVATAVRTCLLAHSVCQWRAQRGLDFRSKQWGFSGPFGSHELKPGSEVLQAAAGPSSDGLPPAPQGSDQDILFMALL